MGNSALLIMIQCYNDTVTILEYFLGSFNKALSVSIVFPRSNME